MDDELGPKQWCELRHRRAHDARSVLVGSHVDERFTITVSPDCVAELVKLGIATRVKSFRWDAILPSVTTYHVLVAWLTQ
jgi:hypothetical protein